MSTYILQKQFLPLPLRFNQNTLQLVDEWQFRLDEIKAFFSNREGSRPYQPNWGFNFNNTDEPYQADELRALILSKLDQFFPYIEVSEIKVNEYEYGSYFVEITIVQSSKTETVTITLS